MDKIILIETSELEILIYNSVKKALSENKEVVQQNSNELFTIDEASQYLNLAKQTLYGLTSKNKIPYIKRGKLYFLKTDLDNWLNEGKKLTIDEIETGGFELLRKKIGYRK